jgi:MFS family permease
MTLTGAVWHVAIAEVLNACFIAAVAGLGMSYYQDLMPTPPGRATTMFTNTYRISAMLAGLIFGIVQIAGYRFSYLVAAGLSAGGRGPPRAFATDRSAAPFPQRPKRAHSDIKDGVHDVLPRLCAVASYATFAGPQPRPVAKACADTSRIRTTRHD